jgi:hypothetical protein
VQSVRTVKGKEAITGAVIKHNGTKKYGEVEVLFHAVLISALVVDE